MQQREPQESLSEMRDPLFLLLSLRDLRALCSSHRIFKHAYAEEMKKPLRQLANLDIKLTAIPELADSQNRPELFKQIKDINSIVSYLEQQCHYSDETIYSACTIDRAQLNKQDLANQLREFRPSYKSMSDLTTLKLLINDLVTAVEFFAVFYPPFVPSISLNFTSACLSFIVPYLTGGALWVGEFIITSERHRRYTNTIKSLLDNSIKHFEHVLVEDRNKYELTERKQIIDLLLSDKFKQSNDPGILELRQELQRNPHISCDTLHELIESKCEQHFKRKNAPPSWFFATPTSHPNIVLFYKQLHDDMTLGIRDAQVWPQLIKFLEQNDFVQQNNNTAAPGLLARFW